MRIILLGARGYLGEHFLRLYPNAVTPSLDIGDPAQVSALLDAEKPDIVINAAGKTGRPNVDWCEDHKEETLHSNVLGPLVLLEECQKRGVYWVHLSSGCIYQGDNGGKGYSEEDQPNFFGSFYSRTKLWADQILKDFPVLILRIRMPFDDSDHDRNLISKLRKYSKVLDVQNSLTYLPEMLTAAKTLIDKRATGVYNIVNPGPMSPYEIMQLYKDIADPAHAFERLTLDHLSDVTKAGRSNCILSGSKLQREGVQMSNTKHLLERYFRSITAN